MGAHGAETRNTGSVNEEVTWLQDVGGHEREIVEAGAEGGVEAVPVDGAAVELGWGGFGDVDGSPVVVVEGGGGPGGVVAGVDKPDRAKEDTVAEVGEIGGGGGIRDGWRLKLPGLYDR